MMSKKAIITISVEKSISLLSIFEAKEIRQKTTRRAAKRKVDNFNAGILPTINKAATPPSTIQPLTGSASGENQDPILVRKERVESSGTDTISVSNDGSKSPPQKPQNLLPVPSLPQIEHSNSADFLPRPF